MMIREILQVENSFQMVLMEEEGDTQISLTWNDLDKKRVEEEYCEGCKTKQLRKMIEGLVEKLIGVKDVVKEEPPKKVEPVVVAKKVTIPKVEPKVVVEKKVEEPIVVVEKNGKGVLYKNKGNGTWFDKSSTRYKSGYWEKKDGKYVGDVENGKPNGLGILIFPDGRKYVGEYKYGRMDGQGTYTYPDGSKEVGEWKSGQPWNVKGYDKNENIIGKWVNGVRQ